MTLNIERIIDYNKINSIAPHSLVNYHDIVFAIRVLLNIKIMQLKAILIIKFYKLFFINQTIKVTGTYYSIFKLF